LEAGHGFAGKLSCDRMVGIRLGEEDESGRRRDVSPIQEMVELQREEGRGKISNDGVTCKGRNGRTCKGRTGLAKKTTPTTLYIIVNALLLTSGAFWVTYSFFARNCKEKNLLT